MGKNKKKKKGAVKAEKNTKKGVDERAKYALNLQPPEENPYKLEDERAIERFWRFNRRQRDDFITNREKLREKH